MKKRQPSLIVDSKLREGDLVLVKDHTAKAFQPRFKGNFRVIKQKGNQVEIRPAEGGETTKVHVTDIKKVIPAEHISTQLPEKGTWCLLKITRLKAFQPRFKGNFRVIKQKGNQVEIRPAEGGETTKVHVTDIKKVIPAEHISTQLPDYNKLGRITKRRLNPKNIPDLDWQLASELHPNISLYQTAKMSDQVTATTQATTMVTVEIVSKPIKLKQD